MNLQDIKKGMIVHISNDKNSRSMGELGSNSMKEKLIGTMHPVQRIIHQDLQNRYIIRIQGNHWFPEDLEAATKGEGLKLNPEPQTEPLLFDPNQLVIN